MFFARRLRRRGPKARRFIVIAAPNDPDEACNTITAKNDACTTASHGACANAKREADLAASFTHAILLTFDDTSARARCPRLEALKHRLGVAKWAIGGGALELDYVPTELLACSTLPKSPLRHIFFARFNKGAPVAELASEYSRLPEKIPQMRAFEWGQLQRSTSAEGYEYIFMTTFDDASGRDAYLAHSEHEAFASKIFSFIDKVIVMDFIEGTPSE